MLRILRAALAWGTAVTGRSARCPPRWLSISARFGLLLGVAVGIETVRSGDVSADNPARRIRVAFSSTVDLGDLPSLMAHALLVTQGYDVVPTFFAHAQLAADALARGQMDVGNGSTRTYWAAIAKGADIATIMEQVGNGWSIMAATDIRRCADLHGRPFAVSGEGSVSAALSRAYIASRCPGTEPRVMSIPGSEHRAAALLSGRLQAAPVELAESVYLIARAPGRFRTLVSFAEELPSVVTTGVHVNRSWAARNPRAVQDYLKALLTIHRQVRAEHGLLVAEARARLRIDPVVLADVVEAHLRTNAWDANGRLTPAVVRDSVAFFVGAASLVPDVRPERVGDLSHLERTLDELGRR
jgi:NitT/TauT family transport system substrate-binding protein